MGKSLFNINKSGYTLIETMISVSLFIVIVVSGTGSLLNANLLHQKSQDVRSIMDSLNYIMEDISRNLRTGYHYQCFRKNTDLTISAGALGAPRSCSDGWAIAFESTEPILGDPGSFDDQWVYYIDNNGKIWKAVDGLTSSAVQISPEEIDINLAASGFSVLGAELTGDSQQPLVIIRLVGEIETKEGLITPFSLQTTVSQRYLDI